MDPYRLRRIGDVTIERVPTKAGDQQSADGDQLTSAVGSDQPPPISADDDNHDSAPAPKLHQPYKMKGKPHRSDNSEDEEEEEEEEEFSDEFESEEEDKVKSGNQYKDWRLGSAVSIDTVPKSGAGSKPKPLKPSRSKVVPRPIVSQPEAFQPEVPDKSVYNLGSAISLETINSRSNDDSNSRREFKPYREDFVSGNPGFDNKGLEPTSSYHERKSEDNYQVPDRSSSFRENQDRSSTSFRENPTSRDGSKQPSDVPYHVTGSSEFNSYKQGDQGGSQYHRDNVRLHQDNESLAQSRDGMSDQRKLSPQDVTDFKSFKLGSSVRLEPVGGGSFDQSRNFSGSYGSGLQQTSPSAMGQYSLSSNNSSEAKMLTDLDAASDTGGGTFKNFLRDEEFKLGSSVSLNPVKSNDGLDSYKSGFPVKSNDGLDSYKSGFPVKSNDGLDSYKSGFPVKSNECLDSFKSGFRLGSGVSLDIVKPKQEVDEYKMEEGEEEYEEEEEDETIAARIANSIAGDRQRETPAPVEEEEVKRKRGDEEVTSDEEEEEEESYGQFGKEQASNINAQEPMQQEPSGEAEGEEAEERGDERREEEEEEEDNVADENAGEEEEEEEEDALNLLGKIKMEVDSDSEMVKIKEEPEEEEEGGGDEEEEGEEKKSGKRKSADSDEEGDDADKDNDNKKKKKTDGSGSDSDSDKKERGPDGKKNANFRRNIREVMDESQLDQATLNAQRQEMERLRRVQEQHRIIREVQKQIQMNKQNSKTETRVISLLQGNTSLVKASPTPAASAASSSSQNTVVVKLSSGSGAPQIVNKKVLEMLRSQKPEPASKTAATSSKVTSQLTRSLLNKPHMMTPSVSIAPVKPPASATPDSPPTAAGGAAKVAAPGGGNDMAAIRKVTGKAKDVVTISSSSSSDEDDCILISEEEDGDEEGPEEEEDPTNSGMHTNDTYNVPDDQGRVLINVGHPDDEPDVFLAPQIARIIKPHQIGGVRFLFDNLVESLERFKTSSGFGCILAHSMGLGKTLQVVSFCDVFLRHTEARTVLCIMPINTLQNWLAEFNMWLPTDPSNSPLSAHGEVRPRNFPIYVLNDLQKTITARAKVVAEWSKEGGVLLIGYELYRQLSLKRPRKVRRGRKKVDPDEELDDKNKPLLEEMHTALVKPGPDLIICDEGHRIKNSHASISQALKQIRSKRRVVLTGYPLQNNLLEYWCMVDFVRPNYLGTKTEFSNMFERPIQNGQCIDSTPQDIRLMRYRAHVLHSLLEGFVQRRSHSVLTNTLPQKEEYVLLIRMTPFQRKLYDTFMNEVVRTKAVPNPLKAFAVCCKIWNHPDVLYHFLKKRANTGEAVDLDLEETAPPLIPPSMPGGMLPPLPGSGILLPGAQPIMPPGAALKPAPAKRGRGRSPKNPNAPKRERKKPASKTPAVAAVMPNAAVASSDNPDNKNQGLPMNNQGNSGPMNHPPGDVSGANPPYNQSYNNPNQFNQYQNQSQPSYPNMGGDQPNNYNQGNYGSQPPPNEFQNQFQPNYSNQNNSFNSSDNFYQGYGNYYPQNPQDGNSSNYNNSGYWGNNSYYNNPSDNPSNFFEGGQFNETGTSGQQQWNQDNFNQQSSNSSYNQGFGSSSGGQGFTGSNQSLNATATSGALSQDQSSNSYSDLQKMEQMGQQRTQGNSMQQGGLYGSVQNDGGQGHAPQGAQSNSNFMGSSQMPPPGSNHPMQGSQHQNTTTNQSLMQLGNPMMSGGHPPPGMHGLGNHMSSMMGGGQSDGSSTHMLQPLGSGNSFGSMGNDQSGGMGGLHHMSGNDPQGNMMGGIHNQGLMNNQPNQNILEGGNNDLIPPPNLQQNNRQHPMMAGRPGSGGGLPGGGQNKIPPPQPINQSGNMSHQQQPPPPYDNQSYMGNMHMPNQGIPGTLGNPSMSSNQGMMMHGMNHPGLSNQMDPNFHKPHDEGGMYRSPYPMSSYHPPSQPDPHQMGPMSGYRPQSTHQQSQHDKLIDDLFNNPSSDLGGGGQDTSNQDRGGILGMSPIKNTGNNMSGGMVNIQPKPVNQSQQYQPFNPPYNDPPQHGYDSSQNPSGFNQSDLMGNYQNASSSGSSGQNYQSSTAVGGSSGQNYQSSTGSSGPSYQSSTGGSGPNYQTSTSVGGSSGQSYQSSSTSVGGSSSQNYQSSTSVGGSSGPSYQSSSSVGGSSGPSYQSSTGGSGQNYQSSSTSVGGSSGPSYQSSTSGSSGQTYPMSGTNNERANHYHDQQQPSMMNNYQNLPQQFDNSGSGANFGGAQSQSYDGSLQNTAGNYGQQSSYMSSMFGGETANSGTGLNEGFGASVKEDKGFEDGEKDEKKGFEKKTWSGDGATKKEVEEEKCETKTEKVGDGEEEDDEEKEMKSCGNQTEEKAGEGKTETTMVKDTSFSFGEMKEVGGTKDAATGEDDKQEGKGEGATNPPTPLVKSGKEDPGIPYDWAERLLKGYMPGDIEASAKMAILFCILEESINLGDRILVFSQSLFTLNLIEDFLQKTNLPNRAERWARNWNYYRLDGSTSALEREKLINEFNSNPNIHLFLVSTRAGSLGINLVGANRVIVFDASWNPCHDTQAVCRVYRYGQKKPCFVYRLVMDHCLEKKIYDRQINKQGMSDRVVDECNPDAHLSIKEVTNLCWDSEETEQAPMPDVATLKDKYIDVVMQRVLDRHGQTLSKEPFQHESLLVDRKDKKLSQAEKRLAKRSYELEKQASINSRPVYGYSGAGNQQGLQIRPTFRAIRGEGGGVVNKPMASVRPMQSELSSQVVRSGGAGGDRPRSWIPAEVWQKQGMSAQEMTLPLDVVIPTNSPDRSSIVLKAGQKVMVLKSPKGIYMQLENGKIIAIRTAIKVGNKGDKKTDKREFTFEGKKEVAVQPNRSRVQNLPIMRNNISIIPRGSGGSTGITSRAGGAGGAGSANRPLARMLGQNSNRPWGTPKQPIATTKPYFGETPPVTVTVTKKKVDAPASSTVRGQAKVERNPSTDESKDKDKGSDDNTDDKDKQPQRSASASSGASEASQRQDSASAETSAKRKVSSEQERLRSTEEELLHDVDDDDYDDEDDDDDDDEDDEEELDNHHMQQQRQASHRMRSMAASRQMSQQRMSAASQQAAAKKSSFTSGAGNRSGSPSVATSTASSSAAGNKMAPNAGQQSTSSMGGSHSTTTNVASQGSATSSSNATTTSSVTSHSSTSSAASSPHTTTSSSSVGASHATTTSMGLVATSGMSHSTTSNMGSSTTSNMGHSSSSNMGSSTTSNVGSSMTSNMGSSMTSNMGSSTTSNMGHSTSSIMGSHATTTSTSSHASSMAGSVGTTSSSMGSAPSAALGTASAEKESRHPQMVPHQQQMSNPLSLRSDQQQHPVSNPSALRSDDYMHSRYSSPGASPVMSRSGQSEVGSHPSMSRSGQSEVGSHPPMSRSGQSEVGSHPSMSRSGQSEVGIHPPMSRSGQSEVGSHPPMSRSGQSEAGSHPPLPKHLGSSVTVSPVASSAPSPSVPINSPNTSRPSSAVSINPPPVGFNPAVSMTPVAANPPPTYHHTPGLTSTGRRYTSTEYTADALSKSSEPTSSYHPALSHLKTISDHSISIFPVDNSKPSSTITSAQYGSAPDYNYRQDFRQTPAPRDYYQGFTGYPSSSATGYYPSSTVTSATVQRKDVKDTPYAGSYDQTYLPPNPFTAAAVGSGYSRSSTYHPQTTPPPSQQPSTTSSGATSDFSRMYSAFHRPEPTSFQPPSRGGVPAVAPPTHQFPPASPYNPYNPYLMNPHPYPHLPPQPPPQ